MCKIKNYISENFSKEQVDFLTKFKRGGGYLLYRIRYRTNPKIILFSSYWGRYYNCNPKGIYEALLRNEKYQDYTFVWAFEDKKKYRYLQKEKNTVVVRLFSKKYYRYCAKAKYFITNVSMPEWIVPKWNQIYINTWHGKPIKKIGCNAINEQWSEKKKKNTYRGFRKSGKRITYLFSGAPFFTERMATAYGLKKNSKKVIEVGYPRNDFLFRYNGKDVAKIKRKLGISQHKTVILYAPTYRDYKYSRKKSSYIYQDHLDFNRLAKELGEEYVIIFKSHNQEEKGTQLKSYKKSVINASNIDDINELFIISDLLISDYSGAIFDFANLKRPIIYYMYDRDKYINQARGIDFDFNELPGPIIMEESLLASTIKNELQHFKYNQKYKKFNAKYNCLDGKNCGNKFIEKYIK